VSPKTNPDSATATAGTPTDQPAQSWADHALSRLSEAGYRRGGSRNRVVELLGNQDCAITPLELDARLNGVGRATVYRAIEQLEELGLLQRIDIGGDSTAYEKVDPRGHHHHHLVCDTCGKVIAFEDEALEKAIHSISTRDGFRVETHEITLRGTCRNCS
jgi:Fur family ferric uptake transcriptional regulator